MSGGRLDHRLARLERRRPIPGAVAVFVLEDGDKLPAWAADAPIRAVLDLRGPDRPVPGEAPAPGERGAACAVPTGGRA